VTTVTDVYVRNPRFYAERSVVPASGHISCTGAPKLPVGIWERGNTASEHFSRGGSRAAGGGAAWYNGPADNEQSELYAGLKLLSPVSHESIYPAQFRLRVDNGSRTIAGAHTR
jgi:hypothetical protein